MEWWGKIKSSRLCQRLLLVTHLARRESFLCIYPQCLSVHLEQGMFSVTCPECTLFPFPWPLPEAHHQNVPYPVSRVPWGAEHEWGESIHTQREQIKLQSPCPLQEELRKKTKFLYCLLLSPFPITFGLAAFTRHTFHCTHIHIGKMYRLTPQRGRRSIQGETSSYIFQYLLLADQYNNEGVSIKHQWF